MRSSVLAEISDEHDLTLFITEQLDPKFKQFTTHTREFVQSLFLRDSISLKSLKYEYRRAIAGGCSVVSLRFWINRGYTDVEAKLCVQTIQGERSRKRHQKRDNSNSNWRSEFNMFSEFYTARGFSDIDASKLAHERQITFSLQKCIARHGEKKGREIWSARQEKWITTLASKSDAEKQDIMRRRVVPLGKASRESLQIFAPLKEALVDTQIICDSDVFYGYENRKEWYLGDNEDFFLFDFCVPKLGLIIEYQGKCWHPDHRLSAQELLTWETPTKISAAKIIENDKRQREFAEKRGFTVYYLWGTDDLDTNRKNAWHIICEHLNTKDVELPINTVGHLLKQGAEITVSSPNGHVPVIEFHEKQRELFDVCFVGISPITCSGDHLFLHENGQWLRVDDIFAARWEQIGKLRVATENGSAVLLSVSKRDELGTVCDLTVDHPSHAYYTNHVVSHNTGKTLLSVAAGLNQVSGISGVANAPYSKLIVTRPIQPLGKDIGFLPGTLEEKMDPWISPIKDSLNFLFGKPKAKREDETMLSMHLEKKKIEIEALTYIRGRSIPDSFIIIDEAQNLSVHELKTIITRVSEGTKIVLTGDIEQIDNTHVDVYSNGLTHAVEKFKYYPISGHVSLKKGERSQLATLASEIL